MKILPQKIFDDFKRSLSKTRCRIGLLCAICDVSCARYYAFAMETQLFISVAVDVIIDKSLYLIVGVLYISKGKP